MYADEEIADPAWSRRRCVRKSSSNPR